MTFLGVHEVAHILNNSEIEPISDFQLSVKPQILKTKEWPLLSGELKLLENLNDSNPSNYGDYPLQRNIQDYLTSGFINVDKPTNVSTTQIIEWIKSVLGTPHVTHCGRLDRNTSGCLVVCLGRATKLVGVLRKADQEYVCSFQLNTTTVHDDVQRTLDIRTGDDFQKDPENGDPRVKSIDLLQYFRKAGMGVMRVRCDPGTCSSSLRDHIGNILGVRGEIMDILQKTKEEYVCSFQLNTTVDDVKRTLELLTGDGDVFQKDPENGDLRVRTVQSIDLLQYFRKTGMGVMRVKCDPGTCVSTLCDHIGKILGVGGEMMELRRTRSGVVSEKHHPCSPNDVMEAMRAYQKDNDESHLRRIVQPLEALLVAYKRIVLQDWAVSFVCKWRCVLLHYVLCIENNIELNEVIVLITTKGEAVALGVALMTTGDAYDSAFGCIAKTELVIMEEDAYAESGVV